MLTLVVAWLLTLGSGATKPIQNTVKYFTFISAFSCDNLDLILIT